MADLEDFFAKRDKKKRGGKKFESVDDVAKVLETRAKERKKAEAYQPAPEAETSGGGARGAEDEEWKEQEDDAPNLAGLKIQEFSLQEEEEAAAAEEAAAKEVDREGPWKVKKPAAETGATPAPAPEEAQPEPEQGPEKGTAPTPETPSTDTSGDGGSGEQKYLTPAQKKRLAEEASAPKSSTAKAPVTASPAPTLASAGGKYVPPGQRAGAVPSSAERGPRHPPRHAPNINDEQYFPSLSSAGRS